MNKYLILALGILALSSCKKEDHNELINQTTTQEISEADKAIEQKILAFKEDVASNTKDGGEISIDEALWNMEAALNYTYCMGAGAAVDPESEETQIEFTADANGQLDFDAVANAYMNLANQYQAAEELLIADGKEYKLVDITNISTPEQLAEGKVVMSITGISGMAPLDGGSAKVDLYQFGPNANWYYGEGIGRWTQLGNTDSGWDAAKLFSNVINYGWPMPSSIPARTGYYTDPVQTYINETNILYFYDNPDDEIHDNILDYLIFYKHINSNGGQPLDRVLRYSPNDEMNFYVSNLETIKLTLDAQYAAQGKEFKCIKVEYKNGIDSQGNYLKIWHEPTYFYGVYHNGSNY